MAKMARTKNAYEAFFKGELLVVEKQLEYLGMDENTPESKLTPKMRELLRYYEEIEEKMMQYIGDE